ncbi:STAS/SEC14 domain-containing protein [Halpernia sp.]|uniref:STAS/SEC14 domain-containing protein n=1 Tax=Halpernia sp. TaxID=2782209 RepID=UPI003A917491
MITNLPQTPDNIVAFKASGKITKEDYENCVIPQIKAKLNEFDELNFLLYLDSSLGDFSLGAMVEDAAIGIKNLTNWNRIAIVTDKVGIRNITEILSVIMPGEYETFPAEDLENAIFWCANGNEKI